MDRSAWFGAAERRVAGSVDAPRPYPGDERKKLPAPEQQAKEAPRANVAPHHGDYRDNAACFDTIDHEILLKLCYVRQGLTVLAYHYREVEID